ncbi:uncharacterized protein A1O9_09644 [Exophiala aquamarina CBS 119918]|uniref:Uncharacterized protein n=1 Tax=Exophiala aquamarina CBS 119918 TaxID=1182545 RepID=A0A072P441_9EURO|nr:uncharacterized protein A1O9_09644 [Exophiala aquamarina CBS 119918]KEF54477.1 hypothetical protein A1O9_09644 [Exophiala aquamarina CBS 119918]
MAAGEPAGYALREYGAFNYLYSDSNLIVFILSQVFIYVSPPLLELANYHVLGRVFYYVPHAAPLPPGKVLRVFGGLMAIIEALNSLGVSLSANPSSSDSTQELGSRLTIAAISMQLAAIVTFVLLATVFYRRCSKRGILVRSVSTPLNTLYISMALIFVRCIYRLVEHLGATAVELDNLDSLKKLSPILRFEVYFYIFEATLMLINSIMWNIWNPGRYLPKNYHVYLARDGRTEVLATEQPDDRSILLKVLSVLTFGLLFRRKTPDRPVDNQSEAEGIEKCDTRPLILKALSYSTFGILFRQKNQGRAFQELRQYPGRSREGTPT